jgi:hypothetical protein
MSIASPPAVRHSVASSLPALLALAMPKCPMCAIALLSAFGIELHASAPVTIALILAPAALLALWHASRLATAVAGIGAAGAIAGRFLFDVPLLFHGGAVVIVAAVVLNYVTLRRKYQCTKC